MQRELATNLEKTLGISQEQIVREEYEMIVLKALFESRVGHAFVFKGGTALRLAYGSPRYSDDLDFSVVKGFDREEATNVLKAVTDHYKALSLVEVVEKKNTYFALFRIQEPFLSLAFSIKFEASLRPVDWQKERDFGLMVLTSNVTSLTVLAQVTTLAQIQKEKKSIQPQRIRDIFDLWFIAQKLGQPYTMDFSQWDAKTVKRELHKLLPVGERQLLTSWLPE